MEGLGERFEGELREGGSWGENTDGARKCAGDSVHAVEQGDAHSEIEAGVKSRQSVEFFRPL